MQNVAMLGTGLIGMFYTQSLNGQRNRDRVTILQSRSEERARQSAAEWGVPAWTTDIDEALNHPGVTTVVIGLPNFMHLEAVQKAVAAPNIKAILCTKPLARNGAEAAEILKVVEDAGVFHGYLEDLVYAPKALKAIKSVQDGAIGDVLVARSRETHPGPHSAWFFDAEKAGGGAVIDLGCHCIEIIRNYVGKHNRPVEVMCWHDTMVHPIQAEDTALVWIRFESGAVGQFEVSWTFRGGMDLRDEISGTEGTIWLNHFLRTGFEMFTSGEGSGYVAEKSEVESGWLFPVGDEIVELGYTDMFTDMFNSLEQGTSPTEDFYDGYVVNCVMDACYRSAKERTWVPVEVDWRHGKADPIRREITEYDGKNIVKQETMPDGRVKMILMEKDTGRIVDITV
ncbi:MAG: Gfo/Idh/MocA family oxidoreductase [Caldilineaceae bacterium SB0662_bin_9]|uniref:Gfo/Idh/MocA family oxidoreductase n=1 Tax=Caldilineaceae bacterium SB0662_bin_9 TaxID=2605258 RepID=A0A6B1DVT6_9CHLR|nr:Gfo/Idh/MocA family oxidoreductase [Caldilineaceae bacterium SB0662_bin_9]